MRGAVVRAIDATQDTLQEGIKRAGIPDAPQGPQAAQIVGTWALLLYLVMALTGLSIRETVLFPIVRRHSN